MKSFLFFLTAALSTFVVLEVLRTLVVTMR
jgi:hypothetical protein